MSDYIDALLHLLKEEAECRCEIARRYQECRKLMDESIEILKALQEENSKTWFYDYAGSFGSKVFFGGSVTGLMGLFGGLAINGLAVAAAGAVAVCGYAAAAACSSMKNAVVGNSKIIQCEVNSLKEANISALVDIGLKHHNIVGAMCTTIKNVQKTSTVYNSGEILCRRLSFDIGDAVAPKPVEQFLDDVFLWHKVTQPANVILGRYLRSNTAVSLVAAYVLRHPIEDATSIAKQPIWTQGCLDVLFRLDGHISVRGRETKEKTLVREQGSSGSQGIPPNDPPVQETLEDCQQSFLNLRDLLEALCKKLDNM